MRKLLLLSFELFIILNLYSQQQELSSNSKYDRNICFDDNKEGYEESVKYFTQIIEEYPDDTMAYYKVGMSYYKLLDYPKAIQYFNQLIKIDSAYTGAYSNRAICKFFMNDKAGACKDWERALQCDYPSELKVSIKHDYDQYCK